MLAEYIVVSVYFIVLLGLGFAFKKFNNNVSDYFRNGCRGTWWLVGASAFVSGISAYTFTGAAGAAYRAGWSVMIIYMSSAMGFFVNYLVFAKKFRQLRATTVPELIRRRFNITTEQLYSWLAIPRGILQTGLVLYGLGIFTSSIFGINIYAIIVVLGIIVLTYSIAGGSWAIMATDFVQCLVVFAMTLLLTVLCLYKLGGIEGFLNAIQTHGLGDDFKLINSPEQFDGSFTYVWAIAIFVKQVFQFQTLGGASRYFAVKDGNEAKKAALLSCLLMGVGSLVWFIPPMTARILYSESVQAMTQLSKPAEGAFAVISRELLPPGMSGLMVVAMIAAAMSTMDTGLNRNAAIIIKNIFPVIQKKFGIRELGDKTMLILSQFITLGCGILGIMLAVQFALMKGMGQFSLMLTVGALVGMPMAMPLFWGIIIKRCPPWAAICSMTFGFLVSLAALISSTSGYTWSFELQMLTVMTAGSIGFFGSIIFAKGNTKHYNREVEDFFKTMNTPVDFENEVGGANDLSQLKITGAFTVVLGLGVSSLVFFSGNGEFAYFAPLFAGGILSVIGTVMIILGLRSKSKMRAGSDCEVPDSEKANLEPVAN